jgi:putative DNA primase/helicase
VTAEELLAQNGIRLEGAAPGRYYTTCPKCSATRSRAHQGNKVLGITIEADCSVHWGCNHCAWRGPQKDAGANGHRGGQAGFVVTYNYRDTAGNILLQKVRNPPGRAPRFWLRRPDGKGGWINGTKGVNTKIIYRADDVMKAIAEGRTIACVEGEKDADNLWAFGIASTCNCHGASEPGKQSKWTKAHSDQLAGANIVVLGDHDSAGYEHQEVTCKLSHGVAKRVRKLTLAAHWPGIPKGGDISDWLAAGHTREDLAALIASAQDYAPSEESDPSAADAEIARLARLTTLQYDQERKGAAERLGVRAAILDKLVAAERTRLNPDDGSKQGHAIAFPDPEPWPDPVEGPALLDGLAASIRKHVVLPDHARDACALWVVHTYLTDRFLISPRLGVRSPTKGCGKTLLLDVLDRVVARSLPTANVTAAAIFRVIEAHQPTLLVDEGDTFIFNNDELRGVLNSGHRKGGAVLRTCGDDHEPRSFATYAPCVIALIGALPDTLHDRAVTIDLKRRLPSEKVEPYRPDRAGHLDVLARKAARWANDHADRIATVDPAMPKGIVNRAADNWRPLLAIADVAEGEWPERARKAAEASRSAEGDDSSRLEILLGDIRDAFADKAETPSVDLVKALIGLEGRPWAELGKSRKPLTQNRLARMLKPLGIAPQKVGPGKERVNGYVCAHFEEAFGRYLGSEGVSQPDNWMECDAIRTSENSQPDSPEQASPVVKCEKPNNDGLPSGCLVAKGGKGDARMSNPFNDGVGISTRRIRDLAEQYQERAYANAQATDGHTRTADCDAWLRQALAEEGVFPEFINTEFRRVLDEVFRV